MGYKRMKKRKRVKIMRDIVKAMKMLEKKEIVDNAVRWSEAMKWFESPNASGYLDM